MTTQYRWIDFEKVGVEGRGWKDREFPYDRFPLHAKERLVGICGNLWDLGHSSTGMCITFRTDSTEIRVRREFALAPLNEFNFNACAFSGFDLYGETPAGKWRWIGTTPHADSEKPEYSIAVNMAPGFRRYRIYLPLRNQLLKAELGILRGSRFEAEPPRPLKESVVFYGTSIVHGAYVSHAGLSHPSRLGRELDFPVINLGVSGRARMEPDIADLLGELDCRLFVIDAQPNMTPELVRRNALPFLKRLRKLRPKTPFLLVETPDRTNDWVYPELHELTRGLRIAQREVYRRILMEGEKNIFYLKGQNLFGRDGEHSVDGLHPGDCAAERMYKKMRTAIRSILEKDRSVFCLG